VPAAYLMGRSLWEHYICRCAPEIAMDAATQAERATSAINLAVTIIPIAFIVILALLALGGRLAAPPAAAGVRTVAVTPTRDNLIWQFMRWSGLLLIPLAWTHVAIGDVLVGVHAIDLDFVALRWATWGWRLFDLALLAFAFGHGMLGLRNVLNDYVTQPRLRAAVPWVIVTLWLIITTIGAVAIIGGVAR
jgi:succinate dehydrogenase / fumarate reductase membrane anchor subunit